jgi:hypothetical protein
MFYCSTLILLNIHQCRQFMVHYEVIYRSRYDIVFILRYTEPFFRTVRKVYFRLRVCVWML